MESLEKIISDHYPEFTGIHPAADLFPLIEGKEFDDLVADIRETGLKYPIDMTPDGLLLDGRNRLRACYEAQQDIRTFVVYGDPIQAVCSANIRRRHLNATERAILADKMRDLYDAAAKARQVRSADNRNLVQEKFPEQEIQREQSRDAAAKATGVNGKYVDQVRDVRIHTPALMPKLKDGTIKLAEAHRHAVAVKNETKKFIEAPPVKTREVVQVVALDGRRSDVYKPDKPTFNRTNDSVAWASWTWNPVTGCNHGCNFCYARAITHSDVTKAAFPFGFDPAFYEYRLEAPKNTKFPSEGADHDRRVFVGSMADLFGKWVPDQWIQQVFDACMNSPQWEYMFLTKWPNRYKMLEKLPKAWFGASVIKQADVQRVEREMKSFTTGGVKWISLEPMLEPIVFDDISWCDLVVIGCQTGTNQPGGYVAPFHPKYEWIHSVVQQCIDAGVPYYLKPNIQSNGIQYPESLPRKR